MKKPVEYLCEKCLFRGVYSDEEDKDDCSNWFCCKVRLGMSAVPCVGIIDCGGAFVPKNEQTVHPDDDGKTEGAKK